MTVSVAVPNHPVPLNDSISRSAQSPCTLMTVSVAVPTVYLPCLRH
jgi:hypothetical protein